MDKKMWYAVMKDGDDDWGTGSFDYDEALKIAEKIGAEEIAVIDANYDEDGNATTDGECIDEIELGYFVVDRRKGDEFHDKLAAGTGHDAAVEAGKKELSWLLDVEHKKDAHVFVAFTGVDGEYMLDAADFITIWDSED